jgi:DNA-binding NarL/FixJ family response regulator
VRGASYDGKGTSTPIGVPMHDNEQYFFGALKAGASGYMLKTGANRDLMEACRATMRGGPFLYPAAVRALVRRLS